MVDVDGFPAAWLRDNCPCRRCRDPRTGQKLLDVLDLPPDTEVRTAERGTTTVTVVFDPDGHRSVFDRAWLRAHAHGAATAGDGRTEADKELWTGPDHAGGPPGVRWDRYLADQDVRAGCLDAVLRHGFALLRGVPCVPGTVLRVAETFGYVRETNYGRLFDVRVEPTPTNLAFTGLAIAPHTDNPYRDPVPTVQLLHCMSNAVSGGDTSLVDGFHAAALLRGEDPAAFEVLARTPVPFAFSTGSAVLRAERPLVGVDPLGRIREVRFNGRSIQPLRGSHAELAAFYAAYRRFAALLTRPGSALSFRLEPGDCMIVDNTRLLHARTAFADTGDRHLQGCYADLDSLASTLTLLRRAGAA